MRVFPAIAAAAILAGSLSLAAATTADAATVYIDDNRYKIAVGGFTGPLFGWGTPLAEKLDLLSQQVWFGDAVLAAQFAEALGPKLGWSSAFDPRRGPVFVYDFVQSSDGTLNIAGVFLEFDLYPNSIGLVDAPLGSGVVDEYNRNFYARVIPPPPPNVPLPASALLLGGALAGLVGLRRLRRET